MNKKCVIGILAHVDAGKTTLSEAMLYVSGKIRSMGRVDHGNSYLDTDKTERERGITVFSKQARFTAGETDFILVDTPGHVDFSAEAERTLPILDYAVLVISASDGIQAHTVTLWKLLSDYNIPVFVFVNKTDLPNQGEEVITDRISKRLNAEFFPMYTGEDENARNERMAVLTDAMLEKYTNEGVTDIDEFRRLIAERRVFPVFFGSALKLDGVDDFLGYLDEYTLSREYGGSFSARIFKINYDDSTRLTYMKITGGTLNVRDAITYIGQNGSHISEKAAQLRLYSGAKYIQCDRVEAGDICAVTGLTSTFAGQGIGEEYGSFTPVLKPVMNYAIILPDGCDTRVYLPKFRQFEEEDPTLHIVWNEKLNEIQALLMGEVQTEILHRRILDRFGVDVSFGKGKILYKETVAEAVEGVGHFEPLRHYAEVHLLIEPLPEGSGIVTDLGCPPDTLDTNWQRLIETNICEKTHIGVLTGAPLTDVKITLIAGKSHLKHTEGGDFREATYRAVRHGLMCAKSVLLEPYYRFRAEIPSQNTGRLINDLQVRCADYSIESSDTENTVIVGRAPVSELCNYSVELVSYTSGRGRIACVPDGYAPCHNAEEIIKAAGYDPCADLENTPDSVFCSHGAGFIVPWFRVKEYMHIKDAYNKPKSILPSAREVAKAYRLSEKQLEDIMLREFGPVKRREYGNAKTLTVNGKKVEKKEKKTHLIVDGYNVIFAWDFLESVAYDDLEHARDMLTDIIINYAAFTKTEVTLVFDAYLVKGNHGHEEMRDGVKIVYTAQDETADTYIERLMYKMGPSYFIRVVTSDKLIQFSALNSGIFRMSSREFFDEIQRVNLEISEYIKKMREENARCVPHTEQQKQNS